MRAAALATAESWLRIDRMSVSRIIASPKVPSTCSTGVPGQ